MLYDFFREKYNIVGRESGELPWFNFKGRMSHFSRYKLEEVLRSVREDFTIVDQEIGFAFIVGKRKYKNDDYYDNLKKQLFQLNIISQNIIVETLENKYAMNNILLQIMSKLGIKYFALERSAPYDYIVGVDTGKHKKGGYHVGGCNVIFDSKGKIRRIQPVTAPASGETIELPHIFESLINKTDLKFGGKRVLLLRDGRITGKEKRGLKKISKRYGVSITFLNVVKNNKHLFYTDSENKLGFITDTIALLLPHKMKGARPIKIKEKVLIDKGNEEHERINEEDLKLLCDLTRLNYSMLFREDKSLRIPAPIHYAHKFVKALGRDWKIDKKLLKEGFLYFI